MSLPWQPGLGVNWENGRKFNRQNLINYTVLWQTLFCKKLRTSHVNIQALNRGSVQHLECVQIHKFKNKQKQE